MHNEGLRDCNTAKKVALLGYKDNKDGNSPNISGTEMGVHMRAGL